MRVIAISDTHQKHDQINLPDGDMLIHAGDWTNRGLFDKMHEFLTWFKNQPHKYKVLIPGNHELSLDSLNKHNAMALVQNYLGKNFHFLISDLIEIEGLKIYGTPFSPIWNHPWAFQRQRGKDIAMEWAKIPDETNILITHGPPYGILDSIEMDLFNRQQNRDQHQGCVDLTNRVGELEQLKLHVFGHLHHDGGKSTQIAGVTFANAAICDDRYDAVNKPIVVDL